MEKTWLQDTILKKISGEIPTAVTIKDQIRNSLGLEYNGGGARWVRVSRPDTGNYPTNRLVTVRPDEMELRNPTDVVEIHILYNCEQGDLVWGLVGSHDLSAGAFLAAQNDLLRFYSSFTGNYTQFGGPTVLLANAEKKWIGVRIEKSLGKVTSFVNGVQYGNPLVNQLDPSLVYRFTAMFEGYATYAESEGNLYSVVAFNRATTDEERHSICSGYIPESLSRRGWVNKSLFNNPTAGAAGWTAYPTISWNGVNLSVTATTGVPGTCGFRYSDLDIREGDIIEVCGNITTATGQINAIQSLLADGFSSPLQYNLAVTGNFSMKYTVGRGEQFFAIRNLNYSSGPTALTIQNLKIRVIGTLLRFEPKNILRSGRWIDTSGNCNDLIKASNTIGPQEVFNPLSSYTRSYKMTLPSSGILTETTVAFQYFDVYDAQKASATGEESFTFNSTGGFLAADLFFKGTPFWSGGQIVAYILSANGSSPTGQRVGILNQTMS